ncbi:MAG: bifunctional DNA primase/polymerase [Planctomycetaceae bacterium]|nr:bifunctional DNA primase/polymerase [Planctomycetaceae bacterium]
MVHKRTLQGEALNLVDSGFRVFPCRPGAKRPATADGLKSATTDWDTVERWWSQMPDANIGLSTDGLLVVDVDPGATWPADPDRELELAAAPTASTPRGGRHHYFIDPSGLMRNTAGRIAEHVDTRATGGYVLACPSVVNGSSYNWLTELDGGPDCLPDPPQWLLQALQGTNGASPSIEIPHGLRTHPGASEGHRNQALCHLVGMHLAEHGATTDLPQLALDWSRRCRPPMPDAQVTKSVEALIRKDQASAKADPKAPPAPGTGWRLTKYSEVEPIPIQWLWKGRLPRGKLVILSGDPGLGKTTVLIDISARVSTGTPFPDGASCPRGQVLFYTLEDGLRDTMIPRLMAAGGDRDRVIDCGPVTESYRINRGY